MADLSTLFSAFNLGSLTLPNRVVMAPMTRSRAIGNVPGALMATDYARGCPLMNRRWAVAAPAMRRERSVGVCGSLTRIRQVAAPRGPTGPCAPGRSFQEPGTMTRCSPHQTSIHKRARREST